MFSAMALTVSGQQCSEENRCAPGETCKQVSLCGCDYGYGEFEFGGDTGRDCPGECSVARDMRCRVCRGVSLCDCGAGSVQTDYCPGQCSVGYDEICY